MSVAGTFNDWTPGVNPLSNFGGGKWARKMTLAPGRYEYRFVVDGEWVSDPKAQEAAPNPFGTVNSVLTVRANA